MAVISLADIVPTVDGLSAIQRINTVSILQSVVFRSALFPCQIPFVVRLTGALAMNAIGVFILVAITSQEAGFVVLRVFFAVSLHDAVQLIRVQLIAIGAFASTR